LALYPLAADFVSVLVVSAEGQCGDDQQSPDIAQFLPRPPLVTTPFESGKPNCQNCVIKSCDNRSGDRWINDGGSTKPKSKHFGFDLPLLRVSSPPSKL